MSKKNTIAFQGEKGAFSEEAALNYFGDRCETIPCRNFEAVFLSVKSESATFGIIPIENTLAGSIHANFDLLLKYNLKITGEINHKIAHALLALPGVTIPEITRIYSHPAALVQCSKFLTGFPDAEKVEYYDTAGSVLFIKKHHLEDSAAIASRFCAKIYDMHIVKEAIQDRAENYTRFLILDKKAQTVPKENVKTTIVFALRNSPGVLHKALSVFAMRDIDLTKIESRPMKDFPFQYYFYLDFLGSKNEKKCINALNNLKEMTTYLKILGSYSVSV